MHGQQNIKIFTSILKQDARSQITLKMTMCKYRKVKVTYVVSDIFDSANMRTWDEGCDVTQQRNTHKITANEIFHVEKSNLLL